MTNKYNKLQKKVEDVLTDIQNIINSSNISEKKDYLNLRINNLFKYMENLNEVVYSPCVKRCKLVDGICVGCHRTSDEITKWTSSSNQEKKEILENCQARKDSYISKKYSLDIIEREIDYSPHRQKCVSINLPRVKYFVVPLDMLTELSKMKGIDPIQELKIALKHELGSLLSETEFEQCFVEVLSCLDKPNVIL